MTFSTPWGVIVISLGSKERGDRLADFTTLHSTIKSATPDDGGYIAIDGIGPGCVRRSYGKETRFSVSEPIVKVVKVLSPALTVIA